MKASVGSVYKYLYHNSIHNCTYVATEEMVEKLCYSEEDFLFDLKEIYRGDNNE